MDMGGEIFCLLRGEVCVVMDVMRIGFSWFYYKVSLWCIGVGDDVDVIVIVFFGL